MMSVIFLVVVCLASSFLGATSVPFKRGRCAMKFVRQKQPVNTVLAPVANYGGTVSLM